MDAVSYLLDTVDNEQGGYDGPYYWPDSKMWEPAIRWFPEMVIPGINIKKCGVIVVLIAHYDFLCVDGLVFSWGFGRGGLGTRITHSYG